MHAHHLPCPRPSPRAEHIDLQLELTLLDSLRLSSQLARSARTPALRRLVVAARLRRVLDRLRPPAPTLAPWPGALGADARACHRTLLEAILRPLVSRDPGAHPEAHTRLAMATQLSQVAPDARGAWRRLAEHVPRAPASLRAALDTAIADLLEVEVRAWQAAAQDCLPDVNLGRLSPAERRCLWQDAQASQHAAAPRLWMWMTLISQQPGRTPPPEPIPFS